MVRSSRRWFRFSRSLTFVHFHDKYTLYSTLQHTQFSSWSMWSGQAAEGSRVDDQWSSWPPTRPSQPPAQPRSAAPWRTARAPARHHAAAARCRLHSHQKHLPRHRPTASCQPQSAAWGQAAQWLSGTVREGTVGQCAGGRRLASSPARAIASVSTAQPLQPSSAHKASCQPPTWQRCCETAAVGYHCCLRTLSFVDAF